MHATFVFLIDGIEGKSDSSDMKEVVDEVVSVFTDRYGHVCDENNWWQPEAVLFQDGTIINAAEQEDWRGRDKFAERTIHSCPEASERWQWGKDFALQCTALELELYGSDSFGFVPDGSEREEKKKKVNDMAYDELVSAISKEIPNSLSKMYATVSSLDVSSSSAQVARRESSIEDYKRSKIARTFELFVESDIKPFTRYTESPYTYRCFDIRHDSYGVDVTDDTVMLFVDIHT
jgi:hypothetical protein